MRKLVELHQGMSVLYNGSDDSGNDRQITAIVSKVGTNVSKLPVLNLYVLDDDNDGQPPYFAFNVLQGTERGTWRLNTDVPADAVVVVPE